MSTTTQTLTLQLKFTHEKDEKERESSEDKKQKKPDIHVSWTEDTVDNEHMGKKKSNSSLISLLHIPPSPR